MLTGGVLAAGERDERTDVCTLQYIFGWEKTTVVTLESEMKEKAGALCFRETWMARGFAGMRTRARVSLNPGPVQ